MVITQPLASRYRARPSGGLSGAVGLSVLIHIAAFWYLVSRFVIAPAIEPPPPFDTVIEPLSIAEPPAPPVVTEDPPKRDPLPPRETIIRKSEVEPVRSPPPVRDPVDTEASGPPVVSQARAELTPAPQPTRRVAPVYPRKAQAREVEGRVSILLTVGTGGMVTSTEILTEDPTGYGFGDSALRAVSKWEFATAAPGAYRVTVRFALQ